ncbi:hypothetical protein DRW41_07315 [Neobacillus piezotolerans]|uniref:Uncharacterized protein n=1 Tax=Neobacillus piezotolerans TaxID=2259171 RepID=A0A3D8GT49_9BACI|nr:hypothetical protein [Neobacillus piezotolerans]RDU37644.1 hypothetical protein DRW41_07315 [Neobacillus piezotolerans]
MCVSNNAIEMQTYRMSEEIRVHSIYIPVAAIFSGGRRVNFGDDSKSPDGYIIKVVLQDHEGNEYEVEPVENGLRFAKGEINYKDYQRVQKSDNRKAIVLFTGTAGSLFITGWAILQLFG